MSIKSRRRALGFLLLLLLLLLLLWSLLLLYTTIHCHAFVKSTPPKRPPICSTVRRRHA